MPLYEPTYPRERVLYSAYVNAPTTGTGAQTLHTFDVPAATLARNGEKLRIRSVWAPAANGNSKVVASTFGAQAIGGTSTTSNGGKVVIDSTVQRTGANAQVTTGDTFVGGSISNARWPTATAVTDTAAIQIAWSATTAAGAGDITLVEVEVTLVPAVP